MDRRAFVAGTLGLLAAPLAAQAQRAARIPSVGILRHSTVDKTVGSIGALREGLRELGYVEGQTIALEYRFSTPRPSTSSGTAIGSAKRRRRGSWAASPSRSTPRRRRPRHDIRPDTTVGEQGTSDLGVFWASHFGLDTNLREEVYAIMQGPEWNVMGNLKHWDVTERLGELDLPVLITSGRHDEMTSALIKPLIEGIPGAESVVFEDSAHLAMAEEPERLSTCRRILSQSCGSVARLMNWSPSRRYAAGHAAQITLGYSLRSR